MVEGTCEEFRYDGVVHAARMKLRRKRVLVGGGGENEEACCVGGRVEWWGRGNNLPATKEGIWMDDKGTYCTVAISRFLTKLSFQCMAVLDVYLDLLSPL